MRSKWITRLGLGGAFALTALGCAQERDPINRVQPNVLDKHFFVGDSLSDPSDDPVFYWRNSVVNASAKQSALGVGSYSGTDKICWEITEDMLISRKAYQTAIGQDDKGVHKCDGTVVAAYKILSHFDIRRDYNPQTGEELNVIVENSSDRPWYERQYMRVDWSTNTVDNPVWGDMFIGKTFGDIDVTPLTYYVSDPNSEDAPHIEPENGYLDITNKYFIAPAQTHIWGMTFPTCALIGFYTNSLTASCDAQEAYVRSAYWKVNPNDDFEPTDNTHAPDDVIANFGGLSTSLQAGLGGGKTQCWDPQYAYTDACYHQFLIKHNFWVKSHQDAACSSEVDADNDGTADECANDKTGYAGNTGSQCDVIRHKCTIPLRDRQIRTNGYWLNKETPADLTDQVNADGTRGETGPLEDVLQSWNLAIRAALAFGRENECRRTGGSRDDCHKQFFVTDDQGKDQKIMVPFGAWLIAQAQDSNDAITACHAPVRPYDNHQVCGPTGEVARYGDIRKNWIFYWPYDSDAMWGGIADLGEDPLTGETHGATATVMGRSATRAAAIYRDFIQVAIGDITVDDLVSGVPQAMYAKTMQNGYAPAKYTKEDLARVVANVDAKHAEQMTPTKLAGLAPIDRLKAVEMNKRKLDKSLQLQTSAQLNWEALAAKLRDTKWEADIVDSHWATGVLGAPPGQVDQSVLEQASPLRGLDNGRTELWRQSVSQALANRGVCFTENDIPRVGSINFQAVGFYYKAKYPDDENLSPADNVKKRGEAIYHDLWKQMAAGIAIHEVGHCLGMRHNFASSYDSPNYMPQYWQLRTGETSTASTQACDPNNPRDPSSPDTCMGPRYLDPETPDEEGTSGDGHPGVTYFGNSSVMEYEMDYLSPGLSMYDQMFVNAEYGGVLETFDDQAHGGFSTDAQKQFGFRLQSQLTEQDFMQRNLNLPGGGDGIWPVHYTTGARIMQIFDSARDCRDATPEEKAKGEWRVIHGKVCSQGPRDHAAWRDFLSDEIDTSPGGFASNGGTAPYWHTRNDAKTGGDMVRVRYRYGETYGTAYWHTNYLDSGADPYEVAHNTALHFQYTYPTTYFRRNNRQYYYPTIPESTADRYFERMRAFHWLVGSSVAQYGDQLTQMLGADDDFFRPYLIAEQDLFGMLQTALLAPEPSSYALTSSPMGGSFYDVPGNGSQTASDFTIGIPAARYIGEEFDSEPTAGGSWEYLSWMKHAGFYAEKALAVRSLVDSRPSLYIIARETYLDGRNVMINFRNDLPQAVDRLLGSVLAEDWDTAGLYFDPSAPQDPNTGEIMPKMMSLMDASPTRPAGSRAIAGNIGYKQQVATAIFSALFSRLGSDMTLVNKTRIWIDGVDGQVSLTTFPQSDQLRFTNPDSGYTYIARKFGNEVVAGKTVEKGISSRMILRANAMLAKAFKTTGTVDQFGAPQLALDANGQPQEINPTMHAALEQYVGLIDAVRQIGHVLGYGPLGGAGDSGDE